ncbi:MAG: hypothetical protein N2203_08765, partial [Bacteroidia bacterium]|nr:hypothetical protein [Bacteroidia bacterium]
MNKEFLIRKMKILLYFIVSPLAFAFEMLPTGVNLSLEFFFNNIMPDIFKTTIYTPIFLFGLKLINIILNYGQYTDKISHTIVALVILLFFLSVVIQQYDDIINLFFKTSTFHTFLGAFRGEGSQGSFASNMLANSVGSSILNDNGGLDNYKHNPNGAGIELSPLKSIPNSIDILDKISNKAADFIP